MIELVDIHKSFDGFEAVKGISFEIPAGSVVGFLGPNGAGKTTTMRMIAGYLPPTSGICRVMGFDTATHALEIQKKLGYLPESNPLYENMEVTDYLSHVGQLRGVTKKNLKEAVGLGVESCGLQKVLGKKIGTLSKGYRQRVGLAQALLHQPSVVILDEPTVGLDPNQIFEIRELIKSIGKDRTVLLSSHILSEVEETCQSILIINEGTLVARGTPSDLRAQYSGGSIYQVGFKSGASAIASALENIPGFVNHTLRFEGNGASYFDVAVQATGDVSEKFFELAVAKGVVLIELKRVEAKLEDVFKRLTK